MPERPPIVINRSGLHFTDKVTIITGGAKGIGEGCVRVFVDAGAWVVFLDRDEAAGKQLETELSGSATGECRFLAGDVGRPEDLDNLVQTAVDSYGTIDCLLNNAGYHPPTRRIDDFTAEEFRDVLNINLVSYFTTCQLALPYLRKSKGSIVNISSLVGEMGQEGASTYAATKGGVNGFTKALAIDEAAAGVRVNAILPSNAISHGRIAGVAACENAEAVDAWIDSNQHNNRSASVEEVGQACLFLATAASSYISGVLLNLSFGAELGYGVKFPFHFLDQDKASTSGK
jgi:NAD(P)-dependent dehydrogenase (short-subunit alcohol dehydrogenase family)